MVSLFCQGHICSFLFFCAYRWFLSWELIAYFPTGLQWKPLQMKIMGNWFHNSVYTVYSSLKIMVFRLKFFHHWEHWEGRNYTPSLGFWLKLFYWLIPITVKTIKITVRCKLCTTLRTELSGKLVAVFKFSMMYFWSIRKTVISSWFI